MRLDPAVVRYTPPVFQVKPTGGGVRFAGRENNIQLTETALVCEGSVLKVTLLGIEVYFRGAVSEWSAVTIPYSRIESARQVNWSLPRWLALASVFLCGWAVTPLPFSLYLLWRLRGRYVVRYTDRAGARRRVMFRIRDTGVRAEFDRKLNRYRRAAAEALGGPEGGA